ncbi:MAG: hypothetical protein EOP49_24880 [Sphingobacteriales bacterium]|nr:MAG: hypothetical protein EOP49_24880 [Sphingobacteriales bacterium]
MGWKILWDGLLTNQYLHHASRRIKRNDHALQRKFIHQKSRCFPRREISGEGEGVGVGLDTRCWILDAGCWMRLDIGYWILDIVCLILGS